MGDSREAEFVASGRLTPRALYGAMEWLAHEATARGRPMLLGAWVDRPHISLGASQSAAAELDRLACARQGLAVWRRPVGGGAVWVDPDQWCLVAATPPADRRADLFERVLPALACLHQRYGLAVERRGRGDLWLAGRKILGSGGGFVGGASVLAAGVLLRFDGTGFASVVRAPSAGFRDWLREALVSSMTAWSDHGLRPGRRGLERTWAECLARASGWRPARREPSVAERATWGRSIPDDSEDEADACPRGNRLLPHGIKLQDQGFLVEAALPEALGLRVRVTQGRITRIACADPTVTTALQRSLGVRPSHPRLESILRAQLGDDAGSLWSQRLAIVCRGMEDPR